MYYFGFYLATHTASYDLVKPDLHIKLRTLPNREPSVALKYGRLRNQQNTRWAPPTASIYDADADGAHWPAVRVSTLDLESAPRHPWTPSRQNSPPALLDTGRLCCCVAGDSMYKGSPNSCVWLTQTVLTLPWHFDQPQFLSFSQKNLSEKNLTCTLTYSSVKHASLLWLATTENKRHRHWENWHARKLSKDTWLLFYKKIPVNKMPYKEWLLCQKWNTNADQVNLQG